MKGDRMNEHTDPKALEALWNRSIVEPIPSPPWYRIAWVWLRENVFKEPFEPVESVSQDEPIRRRIRIHARAVKLARRLHRLKQDEAREILEVSAMLLGFAAQVTRRTRVPH